MPVENFSFLDSLVPSSPGPNEAIVGGDDHIRGIKSVLKQTFPGLVSRLTRVIGPSWGLAVPDGTSAAPTISFDSEATLGFWRSAAGLMGFNGRLLGDGSIPVGSLHQFLVEPPKFGKGGVVPSGGAEYLELDGSTYNTADFPRLASHLGITGSTFTLINVADTGRFLRSRTSTLVVGTRQASALKTHSFTGSGSTDAQGYHAHSVTGSTGFMDRNNPHAHGTNANAGGTTTGGGQFPAGAASGASVNAADINHAHAVSGSTDGQGNHAHNVTVNGTITGDTETRPESLAVIICIKT